MIAEYVGGAWPSRHHYCKSSPGDSNVQAALRPTKLMMEITGPGTLCIVRYMWPFFLFYVQFPAGLPAASWDGASG